MTDQHRKVLHHLRVLREEHGSCYFDTEDISEAVGIPVLELYNHDKDSGILFDLWYKRGDVGRERSSKSGWCWTAMGGHMEWN